MKKIIRVIITIIVIILFIISGTVIYNYYNVSKYSQFYLTDKPTIEEETYIEQITTLREKYNNDDIVGTISIKNTDLNTVILQGEDNDYYLNHLPDKTYNINGSIFLDYRINIDDSDKLLIFGHSSPNYFLPIMVIENYADENYYKEHEYIYIDSIKEEKVYQIFSAYVETSDFDYMKIQYPSDENKLNHYQKLKDNSFYETNVNVDIDDDILIIQTCSNLEQYKKFSKKYMLVIAKRVK